MSEDFHSLNDPLIYKNSEAESNINKLVFDLLNSVLNIRNDIDKISEIIDALEKASENSQEEFKNKAEEYLKLLNSEISTERFHLKIATNE